MQKDRRNHTSFCCEIQTTHFLSGVFFLPKSHLHVEQREEFRLCPPEPNHGHECNRPGNVLHQVAKRNEKYYCLAWWSHVGFKWEKFFELITWECFARGWKPHPSMTQGRTKSGVVSGVNPLSHTLWHEHLSKTQIRTSLSPPTSPKCRVPIPTWRRNSWGSKTFDLDSWWLKNIEKKDTNQLFLMPN